MKAKKDFLQTIEFLKSAIEAQTQIVAKQDAAVSQAWQDYKSADRGVDAAAYREEKKHLAIEKAKLVALTQVWDFVFQTKLAFELV